MDVDRGSPVPVWHQIECALLADIADGVLHPGAQLPNEAAIAARFGVHRHTARRALATLASKGAVTIRRGLGTFVEQPVIDYAISKRTRFTANLNARQMLASHDLLDAADMAAVAAVATALGVASGTQVTRLDTLGRADGVPVSVASSFFPAARFAGLAERYAAQRSVTAVLASFGVSDYLRCWTRLTAVLPTDREAALLRQTRGTPVLAAESLDLDATGVPITFSQVRFAGERVQALVETG